MDTTHFLSPGQRRRRIRLHVIWGALCFVIIAVGSLAADDTVEPTVFVSIPPQAWLLDRLAGSSVSIEVLLEPGHSPATYEPTPKQMARMSQSNAYFAIGVPFEQNLMRKFESSHRNLRVINLHDNLPLRKMADHCLGSGHHHHHHSADRVHADPHVWLSPRLMQQMAVHAADSLAVLFPDQTSTISANLARLIEDLKQCQAKIARNLAPVRGQAMYVFHPAYGYLTDEFGLTQRAIEVEGKEPSARQLVTIVETARTEGAGAIFVQPEFAASTVETVAEELGARIVVLDPLARAYTDNLIAMSKSIAAALRPEGGDE